MITSLNLLQKGKVLLCLFILLNGFYYSASGLNYHKRAVHHRRFYAATLDTVTIMSGDTSIVLDTANADIIRQYNIQVKFKFLQALNGNLTKKIATQSLLPLKNISLKDIPSSITFTAKDWDNKAPDSTIIKTVTILVQQPHLVTNEQNVVINTPNNAANFVIRLQPYTGKAKPQNALVTSLVKSGEARIISGRASIRHYFGTNVNSVDSINLKVAVSGKSYPKNNNVLSFTFTDPSVAKSFKIWPNPDTITYDEWNLALAEYKKEYPSSKIDTIGVLNIPLKVITVGLNDSTNTNGYIDLALNYQNHIYGGSQKIKVSTKDKPFWAEVGTNFDLLDKIKTNNLYVGIFAFDKDIGKLFSNENNLSFIGGVYESQSVSSSSTLSSGIFYRTSDNAYSSSGPTTATTTVKSVGILFSPHLKLTNGKTEDNGLHIFLSFYAELLWQTVSSNFTYPKDSTTIAPQPSSLTTYPYKENTLNYDFRSHYFGFGIPFYIKGSDFNLYVNSVMGMSNQKFYVANGEVAPVIVNSSPQPNYISQLTFQKPLGNWNGFYLVQYRLNEIKYGITFSGEIRGLLINHSRPVVTLALSKKFDLSALLKPLVAPF